MTQGPEPTAFYPGPRLTTSFMLCSTFPYKQFHLFLRDDSEKGAINMNNSGKTEPPLHS